MNFNIFFGFQKNKYFLGYEDFVDILGSSQNWTIFRGHFYALLGLFLRSRYRIGNIFWVAKISNIFSGCLKFLSFFLSIYTGSLIHEHYTRECEFGNFDKIKKQKQHKKNKTTQKTQNLLAEFLFK